MTINVDEVGDYSTREEQNEVKHMSLYWTLLVFILATVGNLGLKRQCCKCQIVGKTRLKLKLCRSQVVGETLLKM